MALPQAPPAFRAVVGTAPAAPREPFDVILAGDPSDMPTQVDHWSPRGGLLPQPGDPCLVVPDDEGHMWLTEWESQADAPADQTWPGVGDIIMSASPTPPSDKYARPLGQEISRADFPAAFGVLNPSVGVATIAIGTVGVVTAASHELVAGDRVWLTTTGAMPSGLIANTRYWVATTPTLSTLTLAATEGGPSIALSGTQSGTHTLRRSPYGLGDGVSTFRLPDLGGRVPIGSGAGTGLTSRPVGQQIGAETHPLKIAEMPPHSHTPSGAANVAHDGFAGSPASLTAGGAALRMGPLTAQGGGAAHNNMQPSIAVSYYIRVRP